MKQLLTILGPTASGKTTLATRLAYELDGEVISADSRQVYRGMTIGTGKDLADYVVEEKPIPYHLIDICDPGTKYNLFEYQRDFLQAYEDIRRLHPAVRPRRQTSASGSCLPFWLRDKRRMPYGR